MKHNRTAPRITHRTLDTGDAQSFSIDATNFRPDAITATRSMVDYPLAGFRLVLIDGGFEIWRGDDALTRNRVSASDTGDVDLQTQILEGSELLTPDELAMLADMEQCAALALLRS